MNYGSWTPIKISSRSSKKVVCKCTCGLRKTFNITELDALRDTYCNHKVPNRKDISGQRFGDWLVIKPTKAGYYLCECQCGCGTKKEIYGTTLRDGSSTSCGKNTTGFKDLTGQRFGNWLVKYYDGNHYWICECQCENKTIKRVHRYSLLDGTSKSCGCITKELIVDKLMKNNIIPYRTTEQREILYNADKLRKYILSLKVKPTPLQLANMLGVNRSNILLYIHRYALDNIVDISAATSEYEDELFNHIKSIVCDVERHNRTILNGLELDIYIPSKKLAIEFNGNYWHSSELKDKHYHQQKTIECAKQGIRLIHIFEYEWISNKNKILRFIDNLLILKTNYSKDRVYIKIIDRVNTDTFLKNNYIGEYLESDISIGCFDKYTDDLLGVMTIGKPLKDTEYQYEIYCVCWKHLVNVVDGLSKMFEEIRDKLNIKSIIVYSNITKFTGNSFTHIGFKPTRVNTVTKPDCILIDIKENIVLHRGDTYSCDKILDEIRSVTEYDLNSSRYFKIYDSGYIRQDWIRQ